MRKRIIRMWSTPAGELFPSLLAVSVAFCVGGLVGLLMAAQVGGGGHESLSAYLQNYLTAVREGAAVSPALSTVLWETIRWPLFVFFMGFTALGILGIPTLFAIRGFLLSFAVASFVRMFGGSGGLLAFFSFGITGLVTVPTLFILGVQGFLSARQLAGRTLSGRKGALPFGKLYFVRGGLCAGVLAFSILLEYWAVPSLLEAVAPLF